VNPIDYLHLQLRLEGKSVIGSNLLRQVEEVPGEEMPLLLFAQFPDGQSVTYFDESLDTGLQKELSAQLKEIHFPQIDLLLEIIKERNIRVESGHYKTYSFPAQAEGLNDEDVTFRFREYPGVQIFGYGGFAERVYVIERSGNIASACMSARENDSCGEAWVFTDPMFRHQGLAQRVVGAWARQLIGVRKVPFYSHKIENTASANLAARLGLVPVFEEVVLSYMNV
jgi:RimJ/RimL family protein N-acetyltransferase